MNIDTDAKILFSFIYVSSVYIVAMKSNEANSLILMMVYSGQCR